MKLNKEFQALFQIRNIQWHTHILQLESLLGLQMTVKPQESQQYPPEYLLQGMVK